MLLYGALGEFVSGTFATLSEVRVSLESFIELKPSILLRGVCSKLAMEGAWSIGLIGGVSSIVFACGGDFNPGAWVKTGTFFFLCPFGSCIVSGDVLKRIGDRKTAPAEATLESLGGICDNLRDGDSATEARKSGSAKNGAGEVPDNGDRGNKDRDAPVMEGLSVLGLPSRWVALNDLLWLNGGVLGFPK